MEAIKKIQKTRLAGLLVAAAVLSLAIGAGSAAANSHEVKPVFNGNTIDIETGDVVFVPMIIADRPADDTETLTREYCESVSWCELRDETDFLRFGHRGEEGNGEDIDFCTDQTLDLWFYIHNGTSERDNNSTGDWQSGDDLDNFWNASNANLDGPSVAHNTVVSLSIPSEAGSSHEVSASIKANRAEEVTDSVQITCSDETKEISLVYVEQETTLSTRAPDHGSIGSFSLVGDIAGQYGASLGYGYDPETDTSRGIVPSCFEFASVVRVQLKVVVSEDTELEEELETDPEEPDETPDGEPEVEEEEEEPEGDPAAEPEDPDPEGKPDIPPLGGGAAPLGLIALSSIISAAAYRVIRSRR